MGLWCVGCACGDFQAVVLGRGAGEHFGSDGDVVWFIYTDDMIFDSISEFFI